MLRFIPIFVNLVAGVLLAIPQSFSDSAETAPPRAVAAPTIASADAAVATDNAAISLDPVGEMYLLTFTDGEPFAPNDTAQFEFDLGNDRTQRIGMVQDAFASTTVFCILENARATCTNRANATSSDVDDPLTVRFLLRIDRWPLNLTVTRTVDGERIERIYTIGGAS